MWSLCSCSLWHHRMMVDPKPWFWVSLWRTSSVSILWELSRMSSFLSYIKPNDCGALCHGKPLLIPMHVPSESQCQGCHPQHGGALASTGLLSLWTLMSSRRPAVAFPGFQGAGAENQHWDCTHTESPVLPSLGQRVTSAPNSGCGEECVSLDGKRSKATSKAARLGQPELLRQNNHRLGAREGQIFTKFLSCQNWLTLFLIREWSSDEACHNKCDEVKSKSQLKITQK